MFVCVYTHMHMYTTAESVYFLFCVYVYLGLITWGWTTYPRRRMILYFLLLFLVQYCDYGLVVQLITAGTWIFGKSVCC